MRLLRGSGLKGLISLGQKTKSGNKNLLRPLINQKKKDLTFLSKYVFNFYVEDPTNKSEKYRRTQIRKLIEELKKNGLNKKKFSDTIRNLKYSNNVVDFYVKKNLNENTFFLFKNNKLILKSEFFQESYEVIFRSFTEIIKLIGKKYYFVRGKKLEKIISEIDNNSSFKGTLGGCIIEKVNQTIIITKEP
jgi:tRNA(Ile)-lysidine synthase